MKDELIKKVLKEGTVTTRNYRYILEDHGDHVVIVRIKTSLLDTTAALPSGSGWEKVWTSKAAG